jgi:ketosteroid isomerase-like protein
VTRDNVEIVRGVYEALQGNDIDGALDLLSTDFELDYSRSRGPESGVFRGRDRIRDVMQRLLDSFSDYEPLETEIIDAGDVVIRVGGFRGRGAASGAEVSATGATVWTFSGGKLVSMTLFQSKSEALQAAGLSE